MSIAEIMCKLFGHKYTPDLWLSDNIQKIKCKRCGKKFGINHDVRCVLDWDAEMDAAMKLIYPEKFKNDRTN